MDGFESAKRMREFEIQCNKTVKKIIIGVSANSEEYMAESAQQAGMDAFLTKPFRIQSLIEIYESITGGEGSSL